MEPDTSERLLSLLVGTTGEVDDLVAEGDAAGGRVVSAPEQTPWGYSGTFADLRRSPLAGPRLGHLTRWKEPAQN